MCEAIKTLNSKHYSDTATVINTIKPLLLYYLLIIETNQVMEIKNDHFEIETLETIPFKTFFLKFRGRIDFTCSNERRSVRE